MGEGNGVGDASTGEGVGAETGATGLLEMVGDGFTAVGGGGEHAATIIATTPVLSPNRPLRTW